MIDRTQSVSVLHPRLKTAAHSGVSYPWITAQSWSECSQLPAGFQTCRYHKYSDVCVSVSVCQPTVCITTQDASMAAWHNGEDDSPSRSCFGKRRRRLLCSTCSFCSEALGGDEEQGGQQAYRSTTDHREGGQHVMMRGVWCRQKKKN